MTGSLISSDTQDAFSKPNHSLLWEHDGVFWGALLRKTDSKTYIWKRDSSGTWTRTNVAVHIRLSDRCDAVMDSASNRVYILASQNTSNRITSATYSGGNGAGGGTWTLDPQVTRITVPGITDGEKSCLAAGLRWQSKTLFAFAYLGTGTSSKIYVNWSTDNGHTWQSTASVIADNTRIGNNTSRGLTTYGLPDATEYSIGGVNYIGLFFGSDPNINGFMSLQEGSDPSNPNNWVFESLPVWTVNAAATADDHVSIIRDNSVTDNCLYAGCKSAYGEIYYGIFHRSTNGTWTLVETEMSSRRPATQFSVNKNKAYLLSTNTDTGLLVTLREFDPTTLTFGSEITIIGNGTDNFRNGGGCHSPNTDGIIFVAGNYTTNKAWEGTY